LFDLGRKQEPGRRVDSFLAFPSHPAGKPNHEAVTVSAGGKKIDSPDAFRRLLRARVVMGEEMTLEVRRDGKPVTLTVDLSPPEPPKT
jgi:S1-C subfamily serine protease